MQPQSFSYSKAPSTRRVEPDHKDWSATVLPYMLRAATFLTEHHSGGLPLTPGARKTSITLEAFRRLKAAGKVKTMLVVAPLRVARQQWRQEAAKWEEFRDFTFTLLHGPKKKAALKDDSDIFLINYEGLVWLCKQHMGRALPFDVVVYDELTALKNSQAQRCKALRPFTDKINYKWGLTGSLFSKGHMGIFGMQLALDGGAALGKYITHYRGKYFTKSPNGFDYTLLPGAEQQIVDAMAPYWFWMDAKDYAQLPPLVDVPHHAQMSAKERALYEGMKKDAFAELPESTVTAANAAAVYVKLAQLANGAIYYEDENTHDRKVSKVHDLKLDMLQELLDELDGEPLLLAYEFQSDVARIKERFGDVPVLGKGTTPTQETEYIQAWNAGQLPLMVASPQSVSHGLNLQEGQACNTCWFSVTWDWERYDQFIRRVRRSGNTVAQVFNHLLIVDGTMDEIKLTAVKRKDFTEKYLLGSLNSLIGPKPEANIHEDTTMATVQKLSRPTGWGAAVPQPAAQQAAPQPAQKAKPAAPKGWGKVAPQEAVSDEREAAHNAVAPSPEQAAAQQDMFTSAVPQHDYGEVGEATPEQPVAKPESAPAKPRRKRRTKAEMAADRGEDVTPAPAPQVATTPSDASPAPDVRTSGEAAEQCVDGGSDVKPSVIADAALRLSIVQAVMANPAVLARDPVQMCRELLAFVQAG